MSATQQVVAVGRPVLGNGRWRPAWRGHLQISDLTWAIAFVVPYAAVFFAFAVYSGERRLTKPPNHASSDFALPSDGLLPLGAALFGPAPP